MIGPSLVNRVNMSEVLRQALPEMVNWDRIGRCELILTVDPPEILKVKNDNFTVLIGFLRAPYNARMK